MPTHQMIKQMFNWYAGAGKHWCTAQDFGVYVYYCLDLHDQ